MTIKELLPVALFCQEKIVLCPAGFSLPSGAMQL